MRVVGTPIVYRFQQLLTVVLALKLRVNAQQRQHMHRLVGQARHDGMMVFQVTPRTAHARAQPHADLPGPAFGDAQAPLRRCNQGDADQPVVDEQADGRKFLEEMLLDQFAHGGTYSLLIARPLGFEDVGEGRLMAIRLVQQGSRFTGVAAIEQADFGSGRRSVWHNNQSPWAPLKHGVLMGTNLHSSSRSHLSSAFTLPPRWPPSDLSASIALLPDWTADHENRLLQYQRAACSPSSVGGAD